MSEEKKVHRLPILKTDHTRFKEIARMVRLPPVEPEKGIQFFPAFDGFETGTEGAQKIDISYLWVPWHRGALNEFDKHPHNEELFIVLQGDFYMIIGASEGGEHPRLEEMSCYYIREGDMFVQKRNVWHTACWPTDPTRPVKYLMILSSHRTIETGQKLDHNVRPLPNNAAVMPDFGSV